MDPRIQQLVDRIPQLDIKEKELRLESNTVCYPIPDKDGQPEYRIADKERFAAIGRELEDISRERGKIEDKIAALSELLGPSLVIPDSSRHDDYAARLRSEFLSRFENKICKGRRQPLTPEEGIQSEEYKLLRNEYQSKLDEIAAQKAQDGETAEAAFAILST